tara:strand:- start:2419 stop:2691 length:273 start_codon:yes stop_codon:yes gene_type:complete
MSDDSTDDEPHDPARGIETAGNGARAWAVTLQNARELLAQQIAESPGMSEETAKDMEVLLACMDRAKADAITYAGSMIQLSAHFSKYLEI